MKDRDAHCIIPSARLVIHCNPCTDPDTPESKLLNAAIRIANGLLQNSVVHNSLIEVGVSAAVLNKESLKVVFEDPYETFADDESPYACAWIDPKKHGAYTIVADLNLLKRYEKLHSSAANAGAAFVCSECRLEEPNFKSLLPVKACCAPFKRSRGQYMLSTAASLSESDDDALDAADAQSVPCGKNQFMIRGNGCGLRFWPKPVALRPAVSAEEATARLRKRPSPDGPERAAPAAARLRADA